MLLEVVDIIKGHQAASDAEGSRAWDTVPCLIKILCTERPTFIQYQKASAELEHPARVLLCAYESVDRRAKVARNEAHIAEQEHQLDQVLGGKERATREAGVAEKNRVEVQIQCNRELKNGRKVTQMEVEAKELGKVVIKLRTKAEIKEGAIKGRGGCTGGVRA